MIVFDQILTQRYFFKYHWRFITISRNVYSAQKITTMYWFCFLIIIWFCNYIETKWCPVAESKQTAVARGDSCERAPSKQAVVRDDNWNPKSSCSAGHVLRSLRYVFPEICKVHVSFNYHSQTPERATERVMCVCVWVWLICTNVIALDFSHAPRSVAAERIMNS